MSLYVYCLSDELADDAVEHLTGVKGTRVSLKIFERIAAVVSEFEDESVAVESDALRAHNTVNASVLARTTPLPFRFGTLVSGSRLADYVASNESAIADALGRVRGCVEMSVKIKWGAEVRRQRSEGCRQIASVEGEKADGTTAPVEVTRGAEVDASSRGGRGTAFLLAKRREIIGDDVQKQRAEEVAAWLAGGVSAFVRESSVRVTPSDALVVRAAHLVERERVEEYRQRVRGLCAERDGLHFLTSGPWPPYSFSELSG